MVDAEEQGLVQERVAHPDIERLADPVLHRLAWRDEMPGDTARLAPVEHDINVLIVVASESYKDFVAGLQKEIAETLSSRPRQATEEYFTGKTLTTEHDSVEVTAAMAKQIYRYLLKNDYTDVADQIADAYHEAKAAGRLADLPEDLKPHAEQVFQLIDSVFSDAQLPKVADGRKPKTNPLNATDPAP
jgi:type III restriction enzyme